MNEHHTRHDDHDVATLIRVAGRRPAVPPEVSERARGAAYAQWRDELRRGARKRRWWGAGLAAAAVVAASIALWLFRGSGGPDAGQPMVVDSITGTVWSFDAGATRPRVLDAGDTVYAGSKIETSAGGRVAIRLASGHSVRLDSTSGMRLESEAELALDRGGVYVASGTAHVVGDPVVVETALGSIEELGTQFEVRLYDDAVRVRLREGAVRVRSGDETLEVAAGNELEIDRDGTVTRGTIPLNGPEWDWITGVAPMLDLEGVTAREFLDWVARERGWTLAFADDEVERTSREVVLGGTVGELTLNDVLDAVLPTCRMTHRVEDGTLIIDAGP